MEDRESMFDVSCPHCAYSARIARSRVPEGGAQARCPKCKGEFLLAPRPLAAASPEPQPPPPAPPVAEPPAPQTPPGSDIPAAEPPPRVGKSGKENRQYRRIPFAVDILVNRAILMKAIDLSQGGLYVHTGRAFVPGSVIELELPLGEQKIYVKGCVQHNQNGVGVGIKFVDLSNEHHTAIFEYLHRAQTGGRNVGDSRKRSCSSTRTP